MLCPVISQDEGIGEWKAAGISGNAGMRGICWQSEGIVYHHEIDQALFAAALPSARSLHLDPAGKYQLPELPEPAVRAPASSAGVPASFTASGHQGAGVYFGGCSHGKDASLQPCGRTPRGGIDSEIGDGDGGFQEWKS